MLYGYGANIPQQTCAFSSGVVLDNGLSTLDPTKYHTDCYLTVDVEDAVFDRGGV